MFTEGTIIFSDPFAYNVDQWKWNQYRHLLDPENSESCSSVILDIIRRLDLKNNSSCCFYKAALLRYTDYERFKEERNTFLNKPNQDQDKIELFKHVFNVLSRIENYIALAIANNNNTYTDVFVDELLNDTLAESIATETEKEELHILFEKICIYIADTLKDEKSKRNFSKSMISAESYIELQKDVQSASVCTFTDEELLSFVLQMIIKYSSSHHLSKLVDPKDAVEIAKRWMNGDEYNSIQTIAELLGFKIKKRGRETTISLEDISSICDGDFGYSASIIANSICEILELNDSISEEVNCNIAIERIQSISQKLKYGLPEQTDVFVYELGFNDRFLAQEIRRIIGCHETKNKVRGAIRLKKDQIETFLHDYPSVFQNRIKNI